MTLNDHIFKDREKVSHRFIPLTLPHREEQIGSLKTLFFKSLENPSQTHLQVAQIVGDVGSGKTVTSIHFGELLQLEAEKKKISLKHIYLNPKVHGSSRITLYRYLVRHAAPEVFSQSLSAEELLTELVTYLQANDSFVFITLDEVDYYIKHSKDSIYDLTRLNEISPGKSVGVLGVIFTARSTKFHEKLDRAELSTLGNFPIAFPSYDPGQLHDILQERVNDGFQDGVITSDVLEYIADIAAAPPIKGDVRYALSLLLYAGNLALSTGSDKITMDIVRSVASATHPSITDEDILNLSEKGRIALLALVRALRDSRTAYSTLREIRSICGMICEEIGTKPFDD
ncbi:MAG: Cdc6/Cdc18 family protein, partial [Nitrososphaerales archaeon]